MRTIERRIVRLEEATGGDCPDCGGPSGAGPSGAGPDDYSSYEVVWVDHAEEEWCETCGRQTGIVIRWPEDLP
jgi:hypothetical protein